MLVSMDKATTYASSLGLFFRPVGFLGGHFFAEADLGINLVLVKRLQNMST